MEYYVYTYADPTRNNEIFYVGKGKGRRCNYHLTEATMRNDTNSHKVNRIKHILRHGSPPEISIVAYFYTESDAYDFETHMISEIGRRDLGKGPLVNLTDSQQGLSPEARKRKSEKLSGKNNPMYGKKHSVSSRNAMSEKKKLLVGEKHPHFGKSSPLKNKTYEEQFGFEKAQQLKKDRAEKIRNARKNKYWKTSGTSKKLIVDDIEFPSIKSAILHFGESKAKILKHRKVTFI